MRISWRKSRRKFHTWRTTLQVRDLLLLSDSITDVASLISPRRRNWTGNRKYLLWCDSRDGVMNRKYMIKTLSLYDLSLSAFQTKPMSPSCFCPSVQVYSHSPAADSCFNKQWHAFEFRVLFPQTDLKEKLEQKEKELSNLSNNNLGKRCL